MDRRPLQRSLSPRYRHTAKSNAPLQRSFSDGRKSPVRARTPNATHTSNAVTDASSSSRRIPDNNAASVSPHRGALMRDRVRLKKENEALWARMRSVAIAENTRLSLENAELRSRLDAIERALDKRPVFALSSKQTSQTSTRATQMNVSVAATTVPAPGVLISARKNAQVAPDRSISSKGVGQVADTPSTAVRSSLRSLDPTPSSATGAGDFSDDGVLSSGGLCMTARSLPPLPEFPLGSTQRLESTREEEILQGPMVCNNAAECKLFGESNRNNAALTSPLVATIVDDGALLPHQTGFILTPNGCTRLSSSSVGQRLPLRITAGVVAGMPSLQSAPIPVGRKPGELEGASRNDGASLDGSSSYTEDEGICAAVCRCGSLDASERFL